MFFGPGQAQCTARQQHQHNRLTRGLHGFQQFFLPSGQVDVVAVAVLAAGAPESGVPLGILAQHQDVDIGRCGFRTGQADAVIGDVADFPAEAEGVHHRSRSHVPNAFQYGYHVISRLRSGPVPQNRLTIGVRSAHEDLADTRSARKGGRAPRSISPVSLRRGAFRLCGRSKGQRPVILQEDQALARGFQRRLSMLPYHLRRQNRSFCSGRRTLMSIFLRRSVFCHCYRRIRLK